MSNLKKFKKALKSSQSSQHCTKLVLILILNSETVLLSFLLFVNEYDNDEINVLLKAKCFNSVDANDLFCDPFPFGDCFVRTEQLV
jgi:hypothetical protein